MTVDLLKKLGVVKVSRKPRKSKPTEVSASKRVTWDKTLDCRRNVLSEVSDAKIALLKRRINKSRSDWLSRGSAKKRLRGLDRSTAAGPKQ